ncbi:hypothetical protein SAMN05444003_1156 [Cognatiyoonia sediminum]|uniref:Uncharacterized protein n=1 Tax=Cognatiyoonia sediminum TaxID=1508389 RepID=A0A1M5N483_9RHOB|nr:hypothetical protein [Cognatiyoonia sediminum]SHG83813.1 hypothetical protein SAMN05444003_1156 [Cognatiyoonia sediminum]
MDDAPALAAFRGRFTSVAASVFLTCLGSAAVAQCDADQELYFSCSFSEGAKAVHVCENPASVTYQFGPTGEAPELMLSENVQDVDYTPWPGIGTTIWEEVVFESQDYRYVVYAALVRSFPENETDDITVTPTGGITVLNGETEIANLRCDEGSAEFPWGSGIYDAKTSLGFCFDVSDGWSACTQ